MGENCNDAGEKRERKKQHVAGSGNWRKQPGYSLPAAISEAASVAWVKPRSDRGAVKSEIENGERNGARGGMKRQASSNIEKSTTAWWADISSHMPRWTDSGESSGIFGGRRKSKRNERKPWRGCPAALTSSENNNSVNNSAESINREERRGK